MSEWQDCKELPGWKIRAEQMYNRRYFAVSVWDGNEGETSKRSTEVIPLNAGTSEMAVRKALPVLARWVRENG